MKPSPIFILLIFTQLIACAQSTIPDKENQIKAALSTAPEEDRESASVMGYDKEGALVELKKGTNNLICVSDDPARPGFQCVCYHRDLEPFMTRGRQLHKEGKSSQEVFNIREKEAKEGALKMPVNPSTLHLLEGKEGYYDEASASVKNANYRYVVYIPWATAESTGLPLKPMVEGGPWIMDPGTHRAHIMITPPPKN